jgi:hypothetical protein
MLPSTYRGHWAFIPKAGRQTQSITGASPTNGFRRPVSKSAPLTDAWARFSSLVHCVAAFKEWSFKHNHSTYTPPANTHCICGVVPCGELLVVHRPPRDTRHQARRRSSREPRTEGRLVGWHAFRPGRWVVLGGTWRWKAPGVGWPLALGGPWRWPVLSRIETS